MGESTRAVQAYVWRDSHFLILYPLENSQSRLCLVEHACHRNTWEAKAQVQEQRGSYNETVSPRISSVGEMAEGIKCLLWRQEDLSSDGEHQQKSWCDHAHLELQRLDGQPGQNGKPLVQ